MGGFGFRTSGFRGWPVARTLTTLGELGFDGVELCLEPEDVRPEKLDEVRCAELRRQIDGAGLRLASVSFHGDGEPEPQRRRNQELALRAAGWLGGEILIVNGERAVTPDGSPVADRAQRWESFAVHLCGLAKSAEESGIRIAVEPEPLLLVGGSLEALDLIAAVGSTALKVNLDVGHAFITDDDLAESVRRLGSAIVHIHLEDIKGKVHRHLLPGEGDIDFRGLRKALDGVGYAGPYVADLFNLGDDPAATAGRCLAALRERFRS